MRVVFVLTYPTYNGAADVDEWLRIENRDRWMPGSLAAMGVSVELWGVARQARDLTSHLPGTAPYRVRLFAPSGGGRKSRNHYSDALVAAARDPDIALFVLIGTDGGIGLRLYRRELRPHRRRFAVIIGGAYLSPLVPHADIVFYESDVQHAALLDRGWRLWRRQIDPARLHRLPKSINTDRFAPRPDAKKTRDIVAISGLTPWKSFDEVGSLSREGLSVAVAGSGPRAAELRRKFPAVEWLGRVSHPDIPALLASVRLYVHAGRREYFPRAIVEAMACGVPVVAFDDLFGEDIVPPSCGLLVNDRNYRQEVAALLADEPRRRAMGAAARAHAVARYGATSSEAANRLLITRLTA
jgi:glycosyltransferase involved in cell wall biosynthesis